MRTQVYIFSMHTSTYECFSVNTLTQTHHDFYLPIFLVDKKRVFKVGYHLGIRAWKIEHTRYI